MRRLLVCAAVALALLPQVSAGEPYVILLDWHEGRSLVGTTSLAMSPIADRFLFEVDRCHRNLLLDLLYDPAETGAEVERVGALFIDHDFLVEVSSDGALVGESRIRNPGYGHPLGTLALEGPYELRLSLANGADVSWQLRLRGSSVFGELACEHRIVVTEIEANPPGPDAGAEWIELYNAGDVGADLSKWTLTTTQGAVSALSLPDGTWLDAGARLVVPFTAGEALDNVGGSIIVTDAFGRVRDTTPELDDTMDDDRTWQRGPELASGWSFANATPWA